MIFGWMISMGKCSGISLTSKCTAETMYESSVEIKPDRFIGRRPLSEQPANGQDSPDDSMPWDLRRRDRIVYSCPVRDSLHDCSGVGPGVSAKRDAGSTLEWRAGDEGHRRATPVYPALDRRARPRQNHRLHQIGTRENSCGSRDSALQRFSRLRRSPGP